MNKQIFVGTSINTHFRRAVASVIKISAGYIVAVFSVEIIGELFFLNFILGALTFGILEGKLHFKNKWSAGLAQAGVALPCGLLLPMLFVGLDSILGAAGMLISILICTTIFFGILGVTEYAIKNKQDDISTEDIRIIKIGRIIDVIVGAVLISISLSF